MPATLKDIAKKVGKSVTTVSRALHDYDDVSPKTKALVQQAAKEMGYTPNILAQRLQKQRTDTIGFILPTFGPRFSDPYFSEFMAGIGNKAAKLGYDILVSTRAPVEEELIAYQNLVQSYRVDGFIIVRTRRFDERIVYLCEQAFPFVAFGRTEDTCNFTYVDVEGETGMYQLAKHLVALGHKRIAFIMAPEEYTFSHHRLNGFRKGLDDSGIELPLSLIVTGNMNQRDGYIKTQQLLSISNPPTAIAASNDLMALGAISAAQESGLHVGKDIAITGFDNIPLAEHSHPPLTTVHQPIYQIGEMLCQMLVQSVTGEMNTIEQKLLEPTLIIRESSSGRSASKQKEVKKTI
jgi:LacI family transcriptional regulator